MPISPNQGATSGGTTVTLTGTNLANATAVHFGQNLATITANTPTSITAVSPAGSGAVETSVTSAAGTSYSLPFYYIQPPFVDGISSRSGPTDGGNTVTLSGANLTTTTSVTFGANSAGLTVEDDGSISVVVPIGAAAGPVSVTVTTAGGTDGLPDSYRYVDAPTITTALPANGPTAGGTAVLLTGTNLFTTTEVTFGAALANFGVISDTQVSVITPLHGAGAVDVAVTTAAGTATAIAAFIYEDALGI